MGRHDSVTPASSRVSAAAWPPRPRTGEPRHVEPTPPASPRAQTAQAVLLAVAAAAAVLLALQLGWWR